MPRSEVPDAESVPSSMSGERENIRELVHEAILGAISRGVDLVIDGLDLGERDSDLLTLVVNATMTLLDRPDMCLDDVIKVKYEQPPEDVRAWWSHWD